jgi:hypothetical protein
MSPASARRPRSRLTVAHVLIVFAVLGAALAAACGGSVFGKVYEYEEDIAVSLDGAADVTINASLPALAALRGLDVPLDPAARFEPDRIRSLYESPVSQVTRVSRPWRRQGRRFVQVRLHVPDVRKLPQAPPFSWATYDVAEKDGLVVYRQTIAASALRPGTLQNVGWTGGELVAFRLHLPSRISWHNARDLETNETSDIARGNILSWEQHLTDRLDGRPITIEVRMERQSILFRTLWLFAGAFTAAVLLIGALIWWTIRKGAAETDPV